MKEKMIFIAHSYHKKTKSCDFMFNYLREFFDVDVYYDNSWETGEEYDISLLSDKYKYVVFWQNIPNKKIFKKIKHDNIIFFPMCDDVYYWSFLHWLPYKNVKVVNFSKIINDKLQKWGFNSIYVQYFIEPDEFAAGNPDEIFFWQRLSSVNIETIKKIINSSSLKLHIHKAIDPFNEFLQPSKEDEEKYNITYSEWFDTKKDMTDFIKTKGIYIAPRILEGIGMSFLEAMAMGKAVVANNLPTMNEYIKHNETGYLVNYKNPKEIDFSNIEEIQKNTYEFAKNGYQNWLEKRKDIIDFISSDKKSRIKPISIIKFIIQDFCLKNL